MPQGSNVTMTLSERTGKKSLARRNPLVFARTKASALTRFAHVEERKMNDLVELTEICKLLGMKENIAKRKAALGLLPFPAL